MTETATSLLENLPALQNLIKRDAESYTEEFQQQWRHFLSLCDIFDLKPDSSPDPAFAGLALFLAHVSKCYKSETESLPSRLIQLLEAHHSIMDPDLRMTLVKSLILLRNKGQIQPERLLKLFFTLFRCPDKSLRALLHSHIVNDIKNSNLKAKNNKLNRDFQNFMYSMLKDSNEIAAKKSLEVMIDLYKKKVWNDAKTVNVIAQACFSPNLKLVATSLNFFVQDSNNETENSDSEDENDSKNPGNKKGSRVNINALKHNMQITKKTKARKAQYDRVIASEKRRKRSETSKLMNAPVNFEAVHLINDPQGFAERLFTLLRKSTSSVAIRFPLRLLILNLLTRLIGTHSLLILGLYEFLISYLTPSQRDVTRILAYTAQASHALVPPDVMGTIVSAIANNFIWSNCASQVVIAGLNALRAVCERCPLAMDQDLLQSLIEDFSRGGGSGPAGEKGVGHAIRGLVGLYRQVNPGMLRRRDRGKRVSMNPGSIKVLAYGETDVKTGVDGALEMEELLRDKRGNGGANDVSSDKEWDDCPDENSDIEQEAEIGSDDDQVPLEENCDEELVEEADFQELAEEEEDDDDDEELVEEDDDQELVEEDDQEHLEDGGQDASDEQTAHEKESLPPSVAIKEKKPATTTAVKSKAIASLMTERILTDKDFRRIRSFKAQREQLVSSGKRLDKIDADDLNFSSGTEDDSDGDNSDIQPEGAVSESVILAGTKRKSTYEERIASIAQGREGREKFGSKKAKFERTSKTNQEKSKKKLNTMMVHKRSVKGKAQRSSKEKERTKRKHITHQKKQYK